MTSLTILIPTWDRPDEVNCRLQEIDSLWKGSSTVIIQVNPGRFDAGQIDPSLCRGRVLLRQNYSNLGMVANIIHGISDVDTEWLWILGDDDKIRNDAKLHLDAGIEFAEANQAAGILFNQWPTDNPGGRILSRSLDTFLAATSFSDILFVTSFVWRLSFFQKNVATFIDYSYSRASHALILLVSQVEGTSSILIENSPLVHYEYVVRWSRLDYLQRITTIFMHPSISLRTTKSKITELLWPQCRWALLSAAHEQLKSGEITMVEWFSVACSFSFHLLSSSRLKVSLKRAIYIFTIPLQIYHPLYFLQIVFDKLFGKVFGWLRTGKTDRLNRLR
ncbi:MAG: glycosyltransferase family 2 protein [Cyanobacteriota bacterium]|jgi:hypothetical protein